LFNPKEMNWIATATLGFRFNASPFQSVRSLLGCVLFALLGVAASAAEPTPAPPSPLYEFRPGLPDGTGKWFLGREIAWFMSHQGAMWLERPEREEEEQPTKLLEALKLKPGEVVADIGAGSGYLSWRMAKQVGPKGKVLAADIQPEMLAILRTNVAAHGVTNVVPVLGTVTDPKLPTNAVDLAIFVDVYHECDHPYEMVQALCRALKPGGRLVFVEYRGEEKWIPIKPLHKMTQAQVRKEMALQPLDWFETLELLPRQHVIIFKRRSVDERRR
jgi:precorrin-6B methylase 2